MRVESGPASHATVSSSSADRHPPLPLRFISRFSLACPFTISQHNKCNSYNKINYSKHSPSKITVPPESQSRRNPAFASHIQILQWFSRCPT
jgi:hypothetical protein